MRFGLGMLSLMSLVMVFPSGDTVSTGKLLATCVVSPSCAAAWRVMHVMLFTSIWTSSRVPCAFAPIFSEDVNQAVGAPIDHGQASSVW